MLDTNDPKANNIESQQVESENNSTSAITKSYNDSIVASQKNDTTETPNDSSNDKINNSTHEMDDDDAIHVEMNFPS